MNQIVSLNSSFPIAKAGSAQITRVALAPNASTDLRELNENATSSQALRGEVVDRRQVDRRQAVQFDSNMESKNAIKRYQQVSGSEESVGLYLNRYV